MSEMGTLYGSDDWKKEKHVPVIEIGVKIVVADEMFPVTVTLGKEIAHPNTTDHHIRWIQLFFKPEGDKFAYQIANCEFTAHGESVNGPDKGPAYTNHTVSIQMKVSKPGVLHATALCNIHGLWENSLAVRLG